MGWGLQKMTSEKQVAASDSADKPIEVVVATDTDSDSLDQSLYVDGVLRFSDSTIYGCDIAEHTKGMPIVFTHVKISGYSTDSQTNWPESYSDLVPYIETSIGF
jgi:hypothetical protein